VEFGEVVAQSRLEFRDDPCGRIEFTPGGLGLSVEVSAKRNQVVCGHIRTSAGTVKALSTVSSRDDRDWIVRQQTRAIGSTAARSVAATRPVDLLDLGLNVD